MNGLIQVRGILGTVDQDEPTVDEVSHLLDHRAWGGFARIDRSSLTEDPSLEIGNFAFLGCLAQINQKADLRGSIGMISKS
ncbi:hypothetical protein IIA15_11625 [candidate division TA06 bacterium]|nr:hypothetical protein [candidate division TA06 bacterium]